jgi:hypothetical protein
VNQGQRHSLALWEEFGVSRSPILSRGNTQWPANRILLQLASEYAEDSVITEAAERWVQVSGCEWPRLINLRRPDSTLEDEIKDVYLDPRPKRGIDHEGHGDRLAGAIPTAKGDVLSWALDGTIKIWETRTGAPIHTIKAHEERVIGVKELPGHYFASWGRDQCLRIYRQKDYSLKWEHQFVGAFIERIEIFQGKRIAILLSDARVFFLQLGDFILQAAGSHEAPLSLARSSNGNLITGAWDGEIKVWDPVTSTQVASSQHHVCSVNHLEITDNGELISASLDGQVSIWNPALKVSPEILTKLNKQVDWLVTEETGQIIAANRHGEIHYLNHAESIQKWDLGRAVHDVCIGLIEEEKSVYALVDGQDVLKLEPSSGAVGSEYKQDEGILCIGVEGGQLLGCLINVDVVDLEVRCNLNDFILPLESSPDGKVLGVGEARDNQGAVPIPAFILQHLSRSGLKMVSPFAHAYSYMPATVLPGRESGEHAVWHHIRAVTPLFALDDRLLVCELNDRIIFLQKIPANREVEPV